MAYLINLHVEQFIYDQAHAITARDMGTYCRRNIDKQPEAYKTILKATSFLPAGASNHQRLWHIANDTKHPPACKTCKTLTSWSSKQQRYRLHCCNACRQRDADVESKRQQTCQQRHGHTGVVSSKEVQARSRQTNLERYGVEKPFQNKAIQQLARANVDRDKQQLAWKQSLITKYGDDNIGRLFGSKRLPYDSSKRWWDQRMADIKDQVNVVPLYTFDQYYQQGTVLATHPYMCMTCNTEFNDTLRDGLNPRCPICYPLRQTNWKQQQLFDWCQTLGVAVKFNDRSAIKPAELDVVFPDHKVAIEFNGLYWHSEFGSRQRCDKHYHYHKTQKACDAGYQLIHVWEDQWDNQQDIVKSITMHHLGLTPRVIYGRNTRCCQIDTNTYRQFCNDNHIQGAGVASVRYGLYAGNELVSVMSFVRSRYNKQFQWEISRLCSKTYASVIGGPTKMFASFIRDYSPQTIITYADLVHGTGEVYGHLGFGFERETSPKYFYVNINEGCTKRYSREQFMKHKLSEELPEYDPTLSERDNMTANGYSRIWDCGNAVWVWEGC